MENNRLFKSSNALSRSSGDKYSNIERISSTGNCSNNVEELFLFISIDRMLLQK